MAGMSKNEKQAWEILLGDIRHARRTYRHLMERAQTEPEKVRLYLSTLDEEVILGDGLLGKLRQVVSGQDANRHRHPLST
jgi:flavoprotein